MPLGGAAGRCRPRRLASGRASGTWASRCRSGACSSARASSWCARPWALPPPAPEHLPGLQADYAERER
eukprot:scaffold2930_cov376-Prasinococcus_capsulatus_cf.AAC.8